MPPRKLLMNASALKRALTRISHEIVERNEKSQEVVLLGIQKGGAHLVRRLGEELKNIWGAPVPVGLLDVSMHRDDLSHQPVPLVHPTSIPTDITGRVVILVDDVLFSGRTTRAAMDALNDFGRPRAIQLAVLIDRGHRQLPIKADFVGKNVPTSLRERIDVCLVENGLEDSVYLDQK